VSRASDPLPPPGRGGPSARGLALAGVALAAGLALAVIAARGPEPPRTMPERVRAVASTLRCPVCQDLSVADSPSTVAQQMRRTIAEDLRAGETPAQIRAGFARSYGSWILLSPPRRGIDLVAWAAPALLLLGGLVIAVAAVRRWTFGTGRPARAQDRTSTLSAEDRRLLDRALSSADEDLR
jgi:cytochrome c-type biogenesis protein CcmH